MWKTPTVWNLLVIFLRCNVLGIRKMQTTLFLCRLWRRIGGRGTIAPRVLNLYISWRQMVSFRRRLLCPRGNDRILGMPQSRSGSLGEEKNYQVAGIKQLILGCWSGYIFFSHDSTVPSGSGLSIVKASRSHSRQKTLSRTLLDEWSARRKALYLTTHNTHKRQTSMLPAGFEPTIPASERPQTHALDRAAKWICILYNY